jgi:hypothetical protein
MTVHAFGKFAAPLGVDSLAHGLRSLPRDGADAISLPDRSEMASVRKLGRASYGWLAHLRCLRESLKTELGGVANRFEISDVPTLKDPLATFLLVSLLSEDDYRIPNKVLRGLELLGQEAAPAIPEFLKMLDSKKSGKCRLAAEALGNIGVPAPEVLEALVKCFENPDGGFGYLLKKALQNLGMPAIPYLLQKLESPNPTARKFAADTLEGFTVVDDAQIELLVRKIQSETDPAVVASLATTITKATSVKHAQVAEALLGSLKDCPNELQRFFSISIGLGPGLVDAPDDDTLRPLCEKLSKAIRHHQKGDLKSALHECLLLIRCTDTQGQHGVIWQLVCLGSPNPSYDARLLSILPSFKDATEWIPEVITKVLPKLKDPCPFVRMFARDTLAALGSESAAVQDALSGDDPNADYETVAQRIKEITDKVLASPRNRSKRR